MALLVLNQKSYKHEISKETNLKDVVTLVSSNYVNEESFIDSVKINNDIYTLNDELENLTISNSDSIEFFTKSKSELAYHLLDSASLFLEMLLNQTERTARLYQENQISEADSNFIELTDTLTLFIELITNIHRSLRFEGATKLSSGLSLHQLEIHLLSVLKAISSAHAKSDTIVLYDLIEHELLDNLKQWKITALPELKSLKTT